MGRSFKPNEISAVEAARQLRLKLSRFYAYCREGRIAGIIASEHEADKQKRLVLDRTKLAVIDKPHGNRLYEPESGRTQVVHSPSELKAWLAQAKEDGATSLNAWLRGLANKRSGVKS